MNKTKDFDQRVSRLREVYQESCYKSVNAFAKAYGFNQPTVSNYMCGLRVPTTDFLLKLAEVMPQYNKEWLLDGIGEKYNTNYVEIKPNENNQHDDKEFRQPSCADSLGIVSKLASLAERLSVMAEKLTDANNRCCELEEQLRKANEIIDKYKSTDELA